MIKKKKTIKVAAAIIENSNNEILCTLRKKDGVLGNLWEFPGGKLEENEDIFTCIQREILEELNSDFSIPEKQIFCESIYEYENFIVHLIAIKGLILENKALLLNEHDALIWLKKENLTSLVWAPADVPIINEILKNIP